MTRLALTALIALSTCFAGCAASQRPEPSYLTGNAYARVCRHPSMTAAAYREAFGCQRPAYAGAGPSFAGARHDGSSVTPNHIPEQTRSAFVASANLAGLD